ncbi:Starch-binding associating with outer membrane [bacterium A37T11]|nr:Starch-binding associating with outer membrane [bacterium A37T11]
MSFSKILMMSIKQFKHIIISATLLSSVVGCNNYLDKDLNSGIVTSEQIWKNAAAIDAVIVSMYDKGLRLDEFDDWYDGKANEQNQTSLSDEAQGSYQKDYAFSNANAVYTYSDYLFNDPFSDRYVEIRKANDFLIKLAETSAVLDENKALYDAEARFIRAMEYFGLVKRYGGVPLLTEPQAYDPGNFTPLQIPRNTEAETYDFIISECKAIADVLPVSRSSEGKYRATKGAALALWSRAALYAGSIAKYSETLSLGGTAVAKGYAYIPSSEATRFFTESYNASKELLEMGQYSLYNKNSDKAQNFYDLFSKAVNGNNGEYIFQKQYNVAGGKGHMWDKMNAPFSYRGDGWGCGMAPSLEMVEAFQYTDGSDGKLKLNDDNGTPRSFDDPFELFAGKDPRLFGSVYLPGSALQGKKIEWKRGIIDGKDGAGQKYQAQNQPDKDNTVTIGNTKYTTSGKDGGADVGDASKTGFYERKFFDETLTDMTDISAKRSSTPWVVFRLGEVYLNLAEACMELGGKDAEALEAVNAIRDRAGIALLTTIDLEKVRHERKVELAFEKLRYWDLKRWRVAHLDVSQGGLTNFRGTALYPWYNLKSGKYTFETGTPPKQKRLFLEKNYYIRLGSEDISSDPQIVQNPGYGN